MEFDLLRRREFITLLGVAAAAWPLAAAAQAPASPAQGASPSVRLGYIWIGAEGSDGEALRGILQGLADVGLVEGRTVVFEARYAQGQPERLRGLVDDLLRLNVALILVPGMVATQAIAGIVKTLPIVAVTADPVAGGLAQSLARPGGNVTGLTVLAGDRFVEKWLALLKDVVPGIDRAGLIYNPTNLANAGMPRIASTAGQTLNIDVVATPVSEVAALPAALATIDAAKVQGLVVSDDAMLLSKRAELIAFAERARLPAVYAWREYADGGGLMSYGTDIFDVWRSAGAYVDKILKGARPADLPIEQPTKYQLVINLKTAKSLGITIPDKLIALSNEVIE
jgi:putative tryptophan/tyrosine transport system substrate-binding protein